jgi:hypothetical protein
MQIEILENTPFDKKGVFLSLKEFRLKYNYICTLGVNDEDLIHYLKTDLSFKDWFKIWDSKETKV